MASIRRYKTGKGETRYSVRWRDASGVEVERAAGPRREDAVRLRVEVERAAAVGELASVSSRASFGEALDAWLVAVDATRRESTARQYASVARDAAPLRGLRVRDVTARRVELLVHEKAQTAPVRAHALLLLVRQVLDDCERKGLTVDRAVRHVRAPRRDDPKRAYLDWRQVDGLVAAATSPDDATSILLAAACGLRWQEVYALTADAASDGRVRVVQALDRYGKVGLVKSKRSRRTIPIPAVARSAVDLARARNPSGPLFPSRTNRWWSPQSWRSSLWYPTLTAAGYSQPWPFRFHDLRHTFAAHLVAACVHPKTMQLLLGHATISTTLDTYGHLFPEAFDDAIAALDATIQGRVWGQCGDGNDGV